MGTLSSAGETAWFCKAPWGARRLWCALFLVLPGCAYREYVENIRPRGDTAWTLRQAITSKVTAAPNPSIKPFARLGTPLAEGEAAGPRQIDHQIVLAQA